MATNMLRLGKTQNWLIDQIRKNDPEIYIDCSILNKVMTGRVKSDRIAKAIDSILKENS